MPKPPKQPKTKKEKDKVRGSAVAHASREIKRHGFIAGELEQDGEEVLVRIVWMRPRDSRLFNVGSVRVPRFVHEFEDTDEMFAFITRRVAAAVDGAAREPICKDK